MKSVLFWIIGIPLILTVLPFLSETFAAFGWMAVFILMLITLVRPFKSENMPGRKIALATLVTLLLPLVIIGSMLETEEDGINTDPAMMVAASAIEPKETAEVINNEIVPASIPIASPELSDTLVKAVSGSDDYLAYEGLFLHAATNLMQDFSCTERHLKDNGGFIRSASVDDRYFTYCGDYDRIDITLASGGNYTIQKKGVSKKSYRFEGQLRKDEDIVQAKIAELEATVRPIPESDFSANLDIYKELLALDPTNKKYSEKVAHYEAMDKADEERIASETVPLNAFRGAGVCNDKVSEWLTHNVAKNAVKSSLKSPRSANFSNYQTQFVEVRNGKCVYFVAVTVEAQNSFGAMLRERMKVAVSIDPETSYGVGAIVE